MALPQESHTPGFFGSGDVISRPTQQGDGRREWDLRSSGENFAAAGPQFDLKRRTVPYRITFSDEKGFYRPFQTPSSKGVLRLLKIKVRFGQNKTNSSHCKVRALSLLQKCVLGHEETPDVNDCDWHAGKCAA